MPIAIEPFQRAAWQALASPARHVLLYGGSRSGKTHLIVLWLVLRALAAPKATQVILRHRFNHLKASIIYGTLPEVCAKHFPGESVYTLNKSDWYAEFRGGGRIWFGGLDDKNRTEKILGQGHSTLYLNECSQISLSARTIATTRLSQDQGLQRKEVCDENPPMVGHWTHQLWIAKRDPSTRKHLQNPANYAQVQMNPRENPHIPEDYKVSLQEMTPKERARFWDGLFGTGTNEPLWTYESIERARIDEATPEKLPPNLTRIVVAVDPSGCSGPEDTRSDEIGISVVGVDDRSRVYVLEDASGHMGPTGFAGWGAKVAQLFYKWRADHVVGERNFGGAMVAATVSAVDPNVPFREVTASLGKHVRAAPVGILFDRSKAFLCGSFPELEAQLIQFSSSGYIGDKSPDRADAMVWGCYALGVVRLAAQGLFDYAKQQAAAAAAAAHIDTEMFGPEHIVAMRAPPTVGGTIFVRSGAAYSVENGSVSVRADDVEDLRALGFTQDP